MLWKFASCRKSHIFSSLANSVENCQIAGMRGSQRRKCPHPSTCCARFSSQQIIIHWKFPIDYNDENLSGGSMWVCHLSELLPVSQVWGEARLQVQLHLQWSCLSVNCLFVSMQKPLFTIFIHFSQLYNCFVYLLFSYTRIIFFLCSYLRQLFRNLFHRQGFTYDYVFDWNMLKVAQKRAISKLCQSKFYSKFSSQFGGSRGPETEADPRYARK